MIAKTPPSGKLWSILSPSKKVVSRWNAIAEFPWHREVLRAQRLIVLVCRSLLRQLRSLHLHPGDVVMHHAAIPHRDFAPLVALALEIIDIRLQGDDFGVTWIGPFCDDGRGEQAEE